MTKKILVLYYTQSGQLEEIVRRFQEPLAQAGHQVELLRVFPEKAFPFPWTGKSFFAVMPDCIKGRSIPLQPIRPKESSYDLIVLGYQPWFLSPSLPVNGVLNDAGIRKLMKGTPVITITGARNMWISALERIKKTLREVEAKHVGNIALVDRTQNQVSVITIAHWMFSGRKDRYLGFFPKPGVADSAIKNVSTFGTIVKTHLEKGEWTSLQNELFGSSAVVINYNLMYTELKGARLFGIWSSIISRKKNQDPWLVLFKYYLIIALFIAAPIILTLHTVLVRPFIGKRIKQQLNYYSGVNLN